jgi:hypothetical protein
MPFSTHDWTVHPVIPFVETWADVKTPGGAPRLDLIGGGLVPDQRRTYCVGTIQVERTDIGSEFSGKPADPGSIPTFNVFQAGQQNLRQVVIVQCNQTERGTDATAAPDPNGIVWQRYFYGVTPGLTIPTRATNARAIAVWEAADDADARVAICGETYDAIMPASQEPSGWTAADGTGASGYIAVYDGAGNLLWTHHFFAGNVGGRQCAITDLSIRVDGAGRDVVTYCGICNHGDPGQGTELSPLRPFAAPVVGTSGGSTTQAAGQWDGFVGRIVRDNGTTSRIFHSIVGGPGQDGLFGLAEINEQRFAVVGSIEADASVSSNAFPIAVLGGAPLVPPYRVGAVLVFDVREVEFKYPPGNLVLGGAVALGSLGAEVATHARDVCIGRDVGMAFGEELFIYDFLYVVGSTSDPDFSTQRMIFQSPPTYGQSTFGGNTDGFVAALWDLPVVDLLVPHTWSYWGGAGYDGLTGVNCWNEFPDHVAVAGFTGTQSSADIGVSTFFFDNAYGPPVPGGSTARPSNTRELFEVRQIAVGGGASDDRPAVMGLANTTDVVTGAFSGGPYNTFGLGQASGGGVAVGNDGRVNVVGRTNPAGGGYPVVGAGRAPDVGIDAVRTELDMLPQCASTSLPGVGRTDGTGWQGPGAAPSFPVFPIPGYTGGTTPDCAIRPFGLRVGELPPSVGRMLIDYEGDAPGPGVDNAAIVVSRPPAVAGSMSASVLWIGFPSTTGPYLYVDGTEIWADPSSWVLLLESWPGNRPYRIPLGAFPTSGSGTISVQLCCLIDPTPGSGSFGFTPTTFGTGCAAEFVASPALWLSF